MLDALIILVINILTFTAGMMIANYYNDKAEREKKDALERQFVRLRCKMDADDPCKPYVSRLAPLNTGDFDGDRGPITEEFMKNLKEKGSAKTSFRKSDIAK